MMKIMVSGNSGLCNLPTLKPKKHLGFTLIELIVVITILVILGTIAFLNLSGFQSSARDSSRIENLSNLKK
ncbi:MAG: type II secretion system protein, partial [Candidatus Gracilibacteria bacterium]|nr:type II secretion system protein [Candidatus Gracilibacteria bacterium]